MAGELKIGQHEHDYELNIVTLSYNQRWSIYWEEEFNILAEEKLTLTFYRLCN